MDGDTLIIYSKQLIKFSIMNKKFIALSKSEQRQIVGGSWLSRAIAWCKTHIFGWSDTIKTLPGEPSCGGVGVSFSI